MKRTVEMWAALVALCLFIAPPTHAQAPPKKVCLLWGAGPSVSVLAVKPVGTVTLSGPITFYSVVSELSDNVNVSYPMIGSGHMNGNLFHFQATGGSFGVGPAMFVLTIEVFYDVVALGGLAVLSAYNHAGPGITSPIFVLAPVDCATVGVPYGKEAEGSSPFEDLLGPGWSQ